MGGGITSSSLFGRLRHCAYLIIASLRTCLMEQGEHRNGMSPWRANQSHQPTTRATHSRRTSTAKQAMCNVFGLDILLSGQPSNHPASQLGSFPSSRFPGLVSQHNHPHHIMPGMIMNYWQREIAAISWPKKPLKRPKSVYHLGAFFPQLCHCGNS